MNLTTEKRYASANGFPGEQIGMSLNQSKDAYRLSRKLYGQQVNLQSGGNPEIDINLPKDGRLLLGLSIYLNYDNAAENPTLNLNVNNTKFINSTGVRAFDVENLREAMYYPLNLPLSGNDQITIDINAVGNAKVINLNFHYQ